MRYVAWNVDGGDISVRASVSLSSIRVAWRTLTSQNTLANESEALSLVDSDILLYKRIQSLKLVLVPFPRVPEGVQRGPGAELKPSNSRMATDSPKPRESTGPPV